MSTNGCVDKNSASFKKACQDYGVSPLHMELLIHSWWKTHDDGSFPSDEFINNKKNGESIEMLDNDIAIAESNEYFDSKEFSDRREAETYYKRLASLYPRRAIGSYTSLDEKIIITLAKPIIPENSKYKDYKMPASGSTITLDNGTTVTVKSVIGRTAKKVDLSLEEGGFLTIFRSETNPNDFYYMKRSQNAYDKPDATHYSVKVEKTVPYYEVYNKTLASTPTTSKESTRPTASETTQFTLPTINIYAGTGENAHLSNFAERPFQFMGEKVSSVEAAFQAFKFYSLYKYVSKKIQKEHDINNRGLQSSLTDLNWAQDNLRREILKANGFTAKSKGRTRLTSKNPIVQSAIDEFFNTVWNQRKAIVAKKLMKKSFMSNPDALKKLLDTGDAILTHTQGRDGWDTLFPRLLTEVREELRQEINAPKTEKTSTPAPNIIVSSEEKDRILSEAKRDSEGNLLAPNGNVSNLNEDNYVLVRTKAFKDWFGDWEHVEQFSTNDIDTSKVDIEEVDKPWKNDKSKVNKTLRIYLKGQHDKGYFELVKDLEFGVYSIHFKTGNADTRETYGSTKEERNILYKQILNALPNGAQLSTWGELSEGGSKALNKLGENLKKVGEREVKDRQGNPLSIPIYQKGNSISKVIDENGEPLLVYHGTNAQFDKFRIDVDDRVTEEAVYTDPITAEEFTSDSIGSLFFSDSYGVAAQYGILGNYKQHEHRHSLVRHLLDTIDRGAYDKNDFKSFEKFVNFLESLSEYNPRFTAIAKYIRKNKEEGKRLTQAEKDAIGGLLIDVEKQMKSIQSWTFQNAADYLDILTKDISFLKKYNNPEGIKRLLNGEIPTELTSKTSDEPYLTIGYSTSLGDYHALRVDENGNLNVQTGGELYKVKDLSEDELNKHMKTLAEAVKVGIANYNAEVSYARLRRGATVFSSFLNIREPFDHDYEGTMMGQGYKGNKDISFGYVAARQRKRATEQGKDGMIYRNIQDPYLADNYAVFDENQIMIVSKEEPQVGKVDNETFERLEKETQRVIDKAKETKTETLEVLGGVNDQNAKAEFDATIVTATAGIALETVLKGVNPVFTEEEQIQIKEALKLTRDGRLRVMSVSRQTDPVFFSKEIVKFLEENSKKPLTDPTRINVIEVWTKHDGEPIQDILEACQRYKVAPMVSFSITGLGNTALEQGVMKYQDLLDRIDKLVQSGALNPATTTVRIDPILVGETKLEDIKAIVEKAKSIGIKKFVTSLVQSYGYLDGTTRDRKVTSGINNALAKEGRAYDWDKYYGRDASGKINFKPKKEYIEEIGNFLVELNEDPDIEIETCAFPVKGLKNSACLDPLIIERVTGVDVTSSDGKYKKDTSRKDCMCYGAHSDMFRVNEKKCFSSCAYCYASHSGDNNLNYYNADGTIKDNPYTRIRINQQNQQTEQTEQMEDKSKKEKENQEFIESNVALSKGLDNLLSSKVLTAVEANEIAKQMVNWISDQITAIQNGDTTVIETYKNQLKNIDINTAERIDIVRAIGRNKLMEDCLNNFMNAQKTGKSFKDLMQLQTIKNNWQALIYLANSVFMENEKFPIFEDGENYAIIEDTNVDADNINESRNAEERQEVDGNSQEAWQREARTREIIQNASSKVKDALRQCYILDESGEKQTTKFGINARVELHDAVGSILRWTQGAQDIDEMVDMLESKTKSNPWVKQLVDKLSDRSGKEADFQSQFFVTFCLRDQLYAVVKAEQDDNGNTVFKSIPVNRNTTLKEAYKSIANQFKIGEHPLFTSKGVNEKALQELTETRDALVSFKNDKDILDENEINSLLTFALHTLGYYVSKDDVATATKDSKNIDTMTEALDHIVSNIAEHKDDSNYQPFTYNEDKDAGSLYGNIRNMLKPITDRLEDTAISSFYESGKMYQTYTLPSYMTNLMSKFHHKDRTKFEKFIEEQYGKSEWFYDKDKSEWRNPWISRMMSDDNARKLFEHKVQLSFNKQAYMTEMGDLQYTMSILTEYFSNPAPNNASEVPAWFRVPMLSNKSSSEFIKFYRYVGNRYKDRIALDMTDIMLQEIARIRTVNIRNLTPDSKGFIKNWDTRGKQFNLLTFLDSYLDENNNSKFGELLKKATSKEGIPDSERITLIKDGRDIIKREMQKKADLILEQYKANGIVKAAASIKNAGKTEEEIITNLEQFIWNDAFAAMNILELTITDSAFYDGAVDLQKRFAQIHAPGIRPNVNATDYGDGTPDSAKPVADKYSRTIVLDDFKGLTSNIIDNLEIVFGRKIENSTGAERDLYINMKKSIIKQFKDINLTDAQAFNSPTSYRKKAILFGRWSEEKEAIYNKLMEGNYNFSDLEKAFGEVLKPFVYTQTMEKVGKENSPIQNIPVPFQNKNSEYLLIMADALLRSEDTGKPNLLRAIYDVMEDSAKKNPTRGIDTVQFDSAVKSGLHDAINLNTLKDNPKGEIIAKEYLLNSIYETNENTKQRTTKYKSSVRLIDWMDYGIQQEVPQHFNDHEQAHGSQIRAITVSELSQGITLNLEGKQVSREEFVKKYEETIAKNIEESIKEIEKEFDLQGTRKERNIAIAKILKRELATSSRYDVDLRMSCLLDENGEFNIPLGDPIQAKRIEQLLNSVIKNRINKQTIAGGPVVQVSNFGTSRSLNIRFNSKEGGLLLTRDEYKGDNYEQYIKDNQAGIAYLEVYAPIYSNDLLRFADEKGNIDVAAIERLDPDLLKMVGYRIPTEDKYSCAPIKIVGFLPREAGDGIMLPAEITCLSGSDFDVDKIYLMRKERNIIEDNNKIQEDLVNKLTKSKVFNDASKSAVIDLVKDFLAKPYDKNYFTGIKVAKDYIPRTEEAYDKLLELYKKAIKNSNNLKVKWPSEGRSYRNNLIVDMTYEVLTHEDSTDKILNPGGFEPQKKLGYMVAAKKALGSKVSWNKLESMSTRELKKLSESDMNLAFIDTHVQFYKQNSAAAALIGMFAVHKVAHAIIERDPLYIEFSEAAELEVPITIGKTTLNGLVKLDPTKDSNQALIGKSLGSLVASAADAAKDPVLNLMNINKDTANILNTAIRLGVPFDDAALLLSQNCMTNILEELNQRRLRNEPASLQGVINDRISKLKEEAGMTGEGATDMLLSEGLNQEQLVTGLTSSTKNLELKALSYINSLIKIGKELGGVTLATRFNSISNAAGPLIVDNLMMEHKMGTFSGFIKIYDNDTQTYNPVVSIQGILDLHPMLKQFSLGYDKARSIMRDMPLYSYDFNNIMESLGTLKVESIIKNRENLSKFADFYNSFRLIANNVIEANECDYYINKFPLEFFYKDKLKKKYEGNLFIDAMKLDIDAKTGVASIKIDITGLDNRQKSVLISGYLDILSKDKELAIKLFKYNFFKGGLGFTPKTFMSLTPSLLKRAIDGYNNSFITSMRNNPEEVVNLFIRNNWSNSDFVKYLSPTHKEITEEGVEVDKPNFSLGADGSITIMNNKSLYARYNQQGYIRTKINGNYKLFKQIYANDKSNTLVYSEISPLGGNGICIEFTSIPMKLIDTRFVEGDSNGVRRGSEGEEDSHKDTYTPDMSLIYKAFGAVGLEKSEIDRRIENFRNKSKEEQLASKDKTKAFLAKQFNKLGINFNEKTLEEEFSKLC